MVSGLVDDDICTCFMIRFDCDCQSSKSLSRDKKLKVQQFMSFTNANEATAISWLSRTDWKVEIAADAFFNHPQSMMPVQPSNYDRRLVEAFFNKYRGQF